MTISKIVPKAATNSVSAFLVSHWLIFSSVNKLQDPRRLSESQAAIGKPKQASEKVTRRIWTILIGFKGATRNFILNVLHKQTVKTVKTLSTHTKVMF